MATIDLNWKAEADKDWITINPKSGNGSTKINVTVEPAPADASEEELHGTITITCLDCEAPNNKKEIPVTRCTTECEGKQVSTKWNNTTIHAGACDTAATVTLTGVQTTTYTNCGPETEQVTTSTEITFSQNDGEPKLFTVDVPYYGVIITVNQEGYCHTPEECNCDSDINVIPTSLYWNYDETNEEEVQINIPDKCKDKFTISRSITQDGNYFSASTVNNNIIKVKPMPELSDNETYSGTLVITLDDDECQKEVSLIRYKNGDPCAGGPKSINGNGEIPCEGGTFTYYITT